ncbi:DUF4231 domain-containing protein [Microbulbifer sp. ANSA005]|uniref:DUF4231 domain-containing protein n=1 Tax=Microbulbifer sp. ANSA005 TaxID=3243362 RepID=UPI00404279D8
MPEAISEADFLQNEISKSIQTLKNKVKKNKTRVKWINAALISLGSIITFTLGVDIPEDSIKIQKNLALFFSALLTTISSWNAFFNYKKLWIRQKTTLLALYQLQNELGYRKSQEPTPELDDIFKKYQLIWGKDSTEWRSIFLKSKNEYTSKRETKD